jgi:acyl-CoA synthetase (AMP-forming)/AMP-acid ligase II
MVDITRFPSTPALLQHWAGRYPDRDAVVVVRDAQRALAAHLSYAELDYRARRIGGWLQERFPPGARVLLLYPPVGYIPGFFGCQYAGMVAVPAPLPGRYDYERRRVRGIAADAGVCAVLTDDASQPGVRAWLAGEGLDWLPVLAADAAGDPAGGAGGDAWRMPELGHDSIALLQYTSGSTAEPKGVVVDHGNLLANAATLRRTLDVPESVRFGGWAPHYHDMGLMAQTLPALFHGSTCVLMSPTSFLRDPWQWLKMVDVYDVGWSAAPNFAYELCYRKVSDEQIAQLDLSRWRHAVNGSEPVQMATMASFAKRFASAGLRADALSACYGLAESTVFVSGAPPRDWVSVRVDPDLLARHRFELVAFPDGRELPSNGTAPDCDVRIVDPDTGAVLPPGRVGEIWLRGPSVARGYWRDDAATAATFRGRTADGDGDFLRTGDLGAVRDGEIYVTGRLKEMLIIRGRNLYPQDVEHELRQRHPELGNVGAVFTVPAAEDGAGEALVVTHEVRGRMADVDLRALAGRIRRTVAREFGVGNAVVALLRRGAVRRTTSGKVQRSAMRHLFLAGTLPTEYLTDTTWEGTT